MGTSGTGGAFSGAGLKSVVRPSPKYTPAPIEAVKTSGGRSKETNRRVRFRPPVVTEITSWKEDTRRMNFSGPNELKAVWPREEPCTLAANDHHDSGLGHHGDPDDEEVIVLEEPERPDEGGPRVVKMPRAPRRKR